MNLLDDLLLVGALALPAWFAARLLVPAGRREELVAAAGVIAVVVPSVLAFSAALLGEFFLRGWHVLVASASLGAVVVAVRWRRRAPPPAPAAWGPGGRLALGLAGIAFVVGLAAYDRDHFRYACVNGVVAAALSPDAKVERHWRDGNRPDDYPGMDLARSMGTGQRYGTTALIAPQVALFDFWGFRWSFALLRALGALHAFLLARRLLGDRVWAGVVGWGIAALHPMVLRVALLDENDLSFQLGNAALFWLLSATPSAVLAALAVGAHVGVRHVGIGLLPAAMLLLWATSRDAPAATRRLRLLGFAAVFLVTVSPCLIHHQLAYGTIFTEEHFHDEVMVPRLPYSFLGIEFTYAGLLNWPFRDELIRCPYNPLPTMLYHPVFLVEHSGVLLIGAALLGLWQLVRTRPVLFVALAGWTLPPALLLAFLELWLNPNKMGIPITFFTWLVVAVPLGLSELRRRWPVLLGLSAAAWIFVRVASSVDVPPDPRAFAALDTLRPEHPAYTSWAKASVGRAFPWPDWSRVADVSELRLGERLAEIADEWSDRSLVRVPRTTAVSSGSTELVFDLRQPLVGRADFVSRADSADSSPLAGVGDAGGDGPAAIDGLASELIDLTAPDAAVLVEGLRVEWSDKPCDVLLARTAAGIGVFLKFGGAEFGDMDDRHFHASPALRPGLVKRTAGPGTRLLVRKPAGMRVLMYETILLVDTLILKWDIVEDGAGVRVSPTRRMFHN